MHKRIVLTDFLKIGLEGKKRVFLAILGGKTKIKVIFIVTEGSPQLMHILSSKISYPQKFLGTQKRQKLAQKWHFS